MSTPIARGDGVAAGRFLVEAARQTSDSAQVSRALEGAPVTLEFRRGGLIVEATLYDGGYFVVEAPAGTYRLEYLRAGERVEFFEPKQLTIRRNAWTCVGTFSLAIARLDELGDNVHNELSVRDDCRDIVAGLRAVGAVDGAPRVEIARSAPLYELGGKPSLRALSTGLRIEFALSSTPALRALYRLPIAHLGMESRLLFLAGAGAVGGDVAGHDLSAAGGYNAAGVGLLGLVGYRWAEDLEAAGPVLGGLLRMTHSYFGIGLRGEIMPEQAVVLTLDVGPLGILGGLL